MEETTITDTPNCKLQDESYQLQNNG